jgi:hypothetical protein
MDFTVNIDQLAKFYNTINSFGQPDAAINDTFSACTFDSNTTALLLHSKPILAISELPTIMKPLANKGEYQFIFKGTLNAGEEKELTLKMPYWPVSEKHITAFNEINYNQQLSKTITFWDSLFSKLPDFGLNEKKAVDVYEAGIMNILTGGLKILDTPEGKEYIQHVNSFQYDGYFIRDAAKFIKTFDYLGMHDLAEKEVFHLLKYYQTPDGAFASHPGQHDGIGQALWSCGEHFAMTHDTLFAQKAFPYLLKAMMWLKNHRNNNGGIIARTSILDNELVQNGHYLGHNIWALMGMKSILPLTAAVLPDSIAAWTADYIAYRNLFLSKVDSLVTTTNGLITPSFEGFNGFAPYTSAFGKTVGIDWGNLMIAYPSGLLEPDNANLSSSMKVWKNLFRENLFLYPVHMDFASLHHYNTQYIAGTMLLRNEQEDVLDYLYKGYLVHTTATNAGPEGIEGTMKDYGHVVNITPHGQSALRYFWMLREMIIREDASALHLMSCLSPEWFKDGAKVSVTRVPTKFGILDLRIEKTTAGLIIYPAVQKSSLLNGFVVHIPFWIKAKEIKADGKNVAFYGESSVTLPSDAGKIEILGDFITENEHSYQNALESYLQDSALFNSALRNHKTIAVNELKQPVKVDGIIAEMEWEGAAKVTDFIMADERASQPVQTTTAYLAKQSNNLLVAFHCNDNMLSSGYPSIWAHDLVAVCVEIDKTKNLFNVIAVDVNNKTEVFEYCRDGYGWITPSVKMATLSGLKTSVVKGANGYDVEMLIPVKSDAAALKMNIFRNDANNETIFNHSVWQFTGYSPFAFEHFGTLIWNKSTN